MEIDKFDALRSLVCFKLLKSMMKAIGLELFAAYGGGVNFTDECGNEVYIVRNKDNGLMCTTYMEDGCSRLIEALQSIDGFHMPLDIEIDNPYKDCSTVEEMLVTRDLVCASHIASFKDQAP